ncbi:MAG: hypothetical protein ABIG56_05645 [Candidatus Omnitrophota bacterium]
MFKLKFKNKLKGGEIKMRKIFSSLVAFAFVITGVISPSFAAPGPSQSLGVSASVPAVAPEVDLTILEILDGDPDENPWTNSTEVTTSMSLDFGQLGHTYVDPADGETKDAKVWYSPILYAVILYAQGFGARYEIRSTCTGIGSIPNTNNYFRLTPAYSSGDEWSVGDPQGTQPPGSALGPDGNAISGTYRQIYTSETSPSTARIVQAYYSIPGYELDGSIPYTGWTGIPVEITPGSFVGNVTITIVAI